MVVSRILLIEDSEFLRQQIKETLTIHDIGTETATTASEARETLKANDIDCILVNHDLPDSSGIEFAESAPAGIPVILLTSTSLESIAADAIAAGVTEFIHKDNLVTGTMVILANRINIAIQAESPVPVTNV
jgi:DNA-binding response OmpR family regulator